MVKQSLAVLSKHNMTFGYVMLGAGREISICSKAFVPIAAKQQLAWDQLLM